MTVNPSTTENTRPAWLKGPNGIGPSASVSPKLASNWVASGLIPVRRLTKKLYLVRPVDVDQFIEQMSEKFERVNA